LNTKVVILKYMGNQKGPIDSHSMKKKILWSQWLPSTVWLPKYLLIFKISFVFRRQTFMQYMMTKFSFLGELSL